MTITWTHFPAGEQGFFRAPVLLAGASDALLIDGGFTLEDGRKLAAAIRATGKRLTAIYVSQSDPDYYFSLGPVRAAFPEAQILAAPGTVAAIQASVQKKFEIWGPKLGDNGPASLADVVVPAPFNERKLVLEGESIEIVEARGLVNRRYLWVPSLRAMFGGVLVFSGVHVWVADTPSAEERKAWIENLHVLATRNPSVVVPGHAVTGAATDASAIAYTRDYLVTFEKELAGASDAAALIAAMKRHYPGAGMGVALEIGAKVAKGEMAWG
ncbi:MBL fold metallo-hydrolase [Pendulispora brunnea]|uniref:MBL fold metallo-hydrolase n=1 Tax=Pendulispora brunnea TaxID=2905690 RepID=A0ABZ2K9C6_9BACT